VIIKGLDMSRGVSSEQIRAGRGLLGISQAVLAERARVGLVTLRRLEAGGAYAEKVAPETQQKVAKALEDLGVRFLDEGETAAGLGVSLARGAPGA